MKVAMMAAIWMRISVVSLTDQVPEGALPKIPAVADRWVLRAGHDAADPTPTQENRSQSENLLENLSDLQRLFHLDQRDLLILGHLREESVLVAVGTDHQEVQTGGRGIDHHLGIFPPPHHTPQMHSDEFNPFSLGRGDQGLGSPRFGPQVDSGFPQALSARPEDEDEGLDADQLFRGEHWVGLDLEVQLL